MKHNDVKNVSLKLTPQNYENIFNVYRTEDGFYFYNILRTINFPEDLDPTNYTTYTTKHGDMWPMISWNAYRTVKLWWLICAVNQIIDPSAPPVPGTELKILRATVVRNILGNINQS